MNDKPFNSLSKEELWNLRLQVVLNSLFTADFRNNLGFDPHPVQDFFDNYTTYLQQLADDAGLLDTNAWMTLDSPEHLYDFFIYNDDDYSWIYHEK